MDGHWLASKISTSILCLAENGFEVRTVITDNHSASVTAIKHLTKMHPSSSSHGIEVSKNLTKTHLLFDSVHIVKNIRNNVLNAKKLAFPPISITIQG